jgi:hypothetical protein
MATKEFNISSNAVTVLNQTADAAENTTKAFSSAKAELRALQQQLLTMDQSSDAFKKASERAAELKDNIGDLSAEINANAGNAFEGLSNNVGLFGTRLMSLDLKGAGQALKGMGSAVGKIDFKTLKDEVGGLAKGLVDLGVSVVSNPFFLAGALIVGLIGYWSELQGAIETYTFTYEDAMNRMNSSNAMQNATKDVAIQTAQIELLVRTVNDHSKSEEDRKKALEKVNTALEANGLAAINDINATGQVIVAKNALIAKLQQEAKVRGKLAYLEELYAKQVKLQADVGATTKLSAANKMITDQLGEAGKFMQATNDFLTSGMGTTITDLENIKKEIEFISESVYNDQEALNALQITGLTNSDANDVKARKDAAAKAEEERKRKRTESQKAQEQLLEDNAVRAAKEIKQDQKLAADKLKLEQELVRAKLSEKEKELYDLDQKKIKEIQSWEGSEEDTLLIIEKYRLAELDINKKYDDAALEIKLANDEKLKAADEKAKADTVAREKQLADDKLAAEKALYEARWSLASASVDLLGTLFAKNKKAADIAFALDKALAIAQVVVNTQREISGYNSNPFWSASIDGGASIKIPAIIGAKLRAAASIATIAGTVIGRFAGGGGGGSNNAGSNGGNGGGTTAPSPANFAFLGNQPNQQPPLQAYVVSGQVSSNLEAQQLIQNQSRLGG